MAKTQLRGNVQVQNESLVNGQISTNANIARSKLATGTASRVVINDGSGVLSSSDITTTELNYLDGLTDNVQNQLNGKVGLDGFHFNVVPTGAINSANTTFTLSNAVYDETHIIVFLNGVAQKSPEDYTLTDDQTIEFGDAPLTGDRITIFHVSSATSSGPPSSSGLETFDVVTTNDTITTLAELAIAEDDMNTFLVLLSARGPTNKHYWNHLQFSARRNTAENAVLVGAVVQTEDQEGVHDYGVTVDISGGLVRVRVTGAIAETVNWKAKIA